MPKALIIYQGETTSMRLLAEKVKQRLEDLGMQVTTTQDKHFKNYESTHEYDIIALGAPCLACRKCHGAGLPSTQATQKARKEALQDEPKRQETYHFHTLS